MGVAGIAACEEVGSEVMGVAFIRQEQGECANAARWLLSLLMALVDVYVRPME